MEVKFLYRDGPIGKMCEQLAFKVLFYFQERRLLQFVYLFFFLLILCCLTVKAKTVEEVIKNRPAAYAFVHCVYSRCSDSMLDVATLTCNNDQK